MPHNALIPPIQGFLYFVSAFALALVSTPIIIWAVNRYQLLDAPDQRKAHFIPTPTMGGISFFLVFLVLCFFWNNGISRSHFSALSICLALLFLVGIIDDTKGINAHKKLILEMCLGILLVHAGFGIKNLQGIFGVHILSTWQIYAFNITLIAGLVNAFNLIDGINGLAGGLGFINSLVFAYIFYEQGNDSFLYLALSFAGALLGFLRYNFHKARIFMGDTGSLHLGLLMAIMGMEAIRSPRLPTIHHIPMILIVSSIWLIPIFDTLRVFAVRISKGKGPFTPDKRHVHHLLLKAGLDHRKASLSLYICNIILIIGTISLPFINPSFNFLGLWAMAFLLIEFLTLKRLSTFYRKMKTAVFKTSQIIHGQLYMNHANSNK